MKKHTITANWLIGFIDGDGYFGLELMKIKRVNKVIDLFYRPVFAITQKDERVLYKIKTYIGCGTVARKSKNPEQFHYRIRSAKQFLTFFCPMLQQKSFQTSKQIQFSLLKEAALFLTSTYQPKNKQHQTYLQQLDFQLKQARHLTYCSQVAINWPWFIGFFEAEGTLDLDITKPMSARLLFKVTQNHKPLLMKIQSYFGCGTVTVETERKLFFKDQDLKTVNKQTSVVKDNHNNGEDASTIIYCFCITKYEDIKRLFIILEKTNFHSKKNIVRIQWLSICRLVIQSKEKKKNLSANQWKRLKEYFLN